MKRSPERMAQVRKAARQHWLRTKLAPTRKCDCGRQAAKYIGGSPVCATCVEIDNRNYSWLRKEWEDEQPSEYRASQAIRINRKYVEGMTA